MRCMVHDACMCGWLWHFGVLSRYTPLFRYAGYRTLLISLLGSISSTIGSSLAELSLVHDGYRPLGHTATSLGLLLVCGVQA